MMAGIRRALACPVGARELYLLWSATVAFALVPVPGRAAETPNWTSIGPSGADVLCLVADPQQPGVLHAGTLVGGAFRSFDGGLNWTRVAVDLPLDQSGMGYPRIFSIAVDPGNTNQVFLSTTVGLFRSTDGGIHVTALPTPTVSGGTFNTLLTNPARPGELFAANTGFNAGYVYRSTDNGQTWSQYTQGMFGTTEALAVDGTGLCATTSTGFYRRPPGGNWSRVGDSPPGTPRHLAVISGSMYLSTSQAIFASDDGGVQWRAIESSDIGPVFHIGQDGAGRALLVGRGRLVTVAPDLTMSEIPGTDFPFTACTGFVTHGTTLVAATSMGIYRSDDGGVSWRPSHEGIVTTDILPLAADPNDPDYFYVASGQLCDSGIYLTTDGGRSWSQRGLRMLNTDVRALVVHPTDRNTLLAGTGSRIDTDGQNGGIWKSTDAGLTWRNVTVGEFPDQARMVIDIQYSPADPNVVYACVVGVFQGFYKSFDGGESWMRKSEGLESMPPTADVDSTFVNYFATLSMAIDPRDPQHIYLGQGGCWGAINVSHDGGEHWIRRAKDRGTPGLPTGVGLEMFKLVIDPDDSDIVYAAGRSEPPVGVYKTMDGGESWVGLEPRVTGEFLANGLVMHPTDHQRLFVATRDGVWTTVNGGGHWTVMNEGLPRAARFGRSVYIHPLRPDQLLFGSGTSGLFSRQLSPGTPVELVRFAATPGAQGGMILDWETANEVYHAGFHLYRAAETTGESEGARIRLTDRMITDGGPRYRFFDATVTPGRYNYYLVEISRSGSETWHAPIRVNASAPLQPSIVRLSAAPNPFSGETVLTVTQAAAGHVQLQVFDVHGRRVASLVDGVLPAGTHEFPWDGRTMDGTPATAGAYFARFTGSDGARWTQKVSRTR